MQKAKSCGVIVMRYQPQMSFLLLQKSNLRYDLPKGHINFGEDEISCAYRELWEETGITHDDIQLDVGFRFSTTYKTTYKRFKGQKVEKTVIIFLGWLQREVNLQLSEHSKYIWMKWNPPHSIQKKTIDPLLIELNNYLFA